MTTDVARRLRAELIELAVDQISRPLAHEFDIRIALRDEADGTGLRVTAASRSVQPVITEVVVDVSAEGDAWVVERDGGAARLDVTAGEADPEIQPRLRHRLSDFVAGCIASAVSRLNAEMQRTLGQRGGSR